MATNLTDSLVQNSGGISSIANALPREIIDKLSLLIDVGRILIIITIIYFIILIISKIWGMRDSHNIKVISREVSEINKKISSLIDKKKKITK